VRRSGVDVARAPAAFPLTSVCWAHFKAVQQTLPAPSGTPRIMSANVPQDDWPPLGDMAVPEQGVGRTLPERLAWLR
jgi:hypothetical protein